MYDIRTPKGKRIDKSINKSNTSVALPGIHKTITYSDPQRTHNKSSYLETIATIASNVEYDKKNTFYVNKEQNQLKSILKKMNTDTMSLVNSIKPRKANSKINKEQQNSLAAKEALNNQKMLTILKNQIEKLKEQYTKIVIHHEEGEINKKIDSIKQEIGQLKGENNQEKVSIKRQGNSIVKQYAEGQDQRLYLLQCDCLLSEARLSKLKGQNSRVDEETKNIQAKVKQIQPQFHELEAQLQIIKGKQAEVNSSKNRQASFVSKKSQLQTLKKRFQNQVSYHHYRYYKILKQLDYQTAICSAVQTKTVELQTRIQQKKQESDILEKQWIQLRRRVKQRGRLVKDFLDDKKHKEMTSQDSNRRLTQYIDINESRLPSADTFLQINDKEQQLSVDFSIQKQESGKTEDKEQIDPLIVKAEEKNDKNNNRQSNQNEHQWSDKQIIDTIPKPTEFVESNEVEGQMPIKQDKIK